MLREPVTRVEYIPAHGYLGVFRRQETGSGPIWPGHDCDLVTHTVQSLGRLSHPVLPAHTAGWTIRGGERSSFHGLGVPELRAALDARRVLPGVQPSAVPLP